MVILGGIWVDKPVLDIMGYAGSLTDQTVSTALWVDLQRQRAPEIYLAIMI